MDQERAEAAFSQGDENSTVENKTDQSLIETKTEQPNFTIIGIGTSAGGLEVLKLFFDNVPADFEHTFVIVQHLSPDYKSLMADLLAKNTTLPIYEVTNELKVKPGSIYLIPPGKNMTLHQNHLRLTDKPTGHILNLPINIFFESLARERQEQSVGIVLSGTGSDGSRGVRSIKEAGGLVIVQRPDTAAFDGMPNSAIGTGVVDLVLAPEEMPDELIRYLNTPRGMIEDVAAISAEDQVAFSQILRFLKQQTDLDFSWYKRPTLLRRMQRRLTINNCDSLAGYLHYLQKNPEEAFVLYREFLIGVTHFFRDPEAWLILETDVLPKLVREKQPKEPFKVWVVGCSSGEEAYTIGILLQEALARSGRLLEVKIFATDVEKEHLDRGAHGVYPESIVSDISLPRLQKFFMKRGDLYQVVADLRRTIIFSQHNALSDPPFGRMDLVICRNFMIYLQPEIQKRLIDTLHYSLNKNGILFLGPSESLGTLKPMFEEISGRWRIYRSKEVARSLGHPRQLNEIYQSIGFGYKQQRRRVEIHMADALNQALMKELGAACVYVDGSFNIIHAIGQYKEYLELPDDAFSTNLLDLAPDSLKLALTTAVRKASRLDEQINITDSWRRQGDDELRRLHLLVSPFNLPVDGGACYLILFIPAPINELLPPPSIDISNVDHEAEQTIVLEEALKESQANLQAALEEAQTTNEELQATNEELMAANEELQSTNEELQSVNEELHTVNAEYQLKIDELAALNADIDNLLRSTQIGTIFLDSNKRIRRFTPAVQSQFDLMEADIGRPLEHLAGKFAQKDLDIMNEHISSVLSNGQPFEREIQTRDGRYYLKRIYPFINARQEIRGVVLTFVEISPLKQAQEAIIKRDELLRHTEQIAHVGSWELEIATGKSYWSDEFFRICGFEPGSFEPTAELGMEIIHPEDRERASTAVTESIENHKPYMIEKRIVRPDGEIRHVLSRGDILLNDQNQPEKLRGFFADITERKQAEEAAQQAEQQFAIFFQNAPIGLSITAPNGQLIRVNQAFCDMLGYSLDEMSQFTFENITHPDDLAASKTILSDLLAGKKAKKVLDKRFVSKTGNEIWTQVRTALYRDSSGNPVYFLTNIIDITQLKEGEEIQARFESVFNATDDLVSFVDTDYVLRAINERYLEYWQTSHDEVIGKHIADLMNHETFKEVVFPKLETSMNGQRVRYQSDFNFPGRGYRYMDIACNPVLRADGTIAGVAINSRDITELKEKEDQLSAALLQLRSSNAELEQFAYAASHDLQEPLNTIANFTGLLRDDYSSQLDEAGIELLNITHDGALRMKSMIEALLKYSRLRRTELNYEVIDCERIITELHHDLQDMIERTQTEIIYDHCEKIYGDATMIRQLLQNLIANAIKFKRPDVPPRVVISVEEKQHEWFVSVQDNGIGIDQNNYDEIFGIFRRLHTREEYEGTGLGLALCKQIVELHGGEIGLTSQPGEGSTFYFTLAKSENTYVAD